MVGPFIESENLRHIRGLLVVVACVAVFTLLWFLYVFYWPNTFESAQEKSFYISRGETFTQVVDSLKTQGIIRSRSLFTLVANLHGGTSRVQVGKFIIRNGASNNEVFAVLKNGKGAVLIPVTIREGLTIRRQARVFGRQLGIDTTRYARLANDSAFVQSLGVPGGSLEGYLFPNTYAFAWQADERDILRRLVDQFFKEYNDTLRQRASARGLTTREVLCMASIVEGETHLDDERPIVAGVYYNRLRKRMYLDADPTIQYILEGGPRLLSRSDLKLLSPYNTYLHFGLPPGPVNNPGLAAVKAAIEPARHQYLYFVANGKGGHWFSSTYDEHLRNVYKARRLRALAGKGS